MPELPEVETMVRGIRETAEGATIIRVQRPRCAYRSISIQPGIRILQQRVAGATIESAYRRAKRIVLHLSTDDRFVIEPRMTGLMLIENAPEETHYRFAWRLQNHETSTTLWFWDRRGLGTIRLFAPAEYEEALGPARLGPDALEMTPSLWRKQLGRTARPIKVALLDQKIVAGIGNLYASEILHAARISPLMPTPQLTDAHFRRLHRATRKILETAIRYEGSTLSDGTYRNALNQDGSYQNEHRVYMKHDLPCPTCRKEPVQKIVQAQRSTFYCPHCQKVS